MVLTPNHLPLDPSGSLSPLVLPTKGYPLPPPLRKSSTGSFSKLSEFHLDDGVDGAENGVEGVRHVELSVDAG